MVNTRYSCCKSRRGGVNRSLFKGTSIFNSRRVGMKDRKMRMLGPNSKIARSQARGAAVSRGLQKTPAACSSQLRPQLSAGQRVRSHSGQVGSHARPGAWRHQWATRPPPSTCLRFEGKVTVNNKRNKKATWWAREFGPAPFPTRAGSTLLRQPGGPVTLWAYWTLPNLTRTPGQDGKFYSLPPTPKTSK